MKTNPENLKSCSSRCWFAKKDKCDCICKGKNHQVGNELPKEVLKDMEENYEEYKHLRKQERKMKRKGIPFKQDSNKIMNSIIKRRLKKR